MRGNGLFDKNRIIRLAQKCNVRYGQRVRAFEITTLTEDDYDEPEDEISGGAPFCLDGGVFCESGGVEDCASSVDCPDRVPSWNLCGMHNFDAWWTGDHWLIVTDGYKCIYQTGRGYTDDWSIGIYFSPLLQ